MLELYNPLGLDFTQVTFGPTEFAVAKVQAPLADMEIKFILDQIKNKDFLIITTPEMYRDIDFVLEKPFGFNGELNEIREKILVYHEEEIPVYAPHILALPGVPPLALYSDLYGVPLTIISLNYDFKDQDADKLKEKIEFAFELKQKRNDFGRISED